MQVQTDSYRPLLSFHSDHNVSDFDAAWGDLWDEIDETKLNTFERNGKKAMKEGRRFLEEAETAHQCRTLKWAWGVTTVVEGGTLAGSLGLYFAPPFAAVTVPVAVPPMLLCMSVTSLAILFNFAMCGYKDYMSDASREQRAELKNWKKVSWFAVQEETKYLVATGSPSEKAGLKLMMKKDLKNIQI